MTLITLDTSKGQLVPLYFGQDALAANQSDVELPVVMAEASQAVTTGYTMPFPGEVVAVSGSLSAAGSAGTFTFGASLDGTEDADTTCTVTTSQKPYQKVQRGKAKFVAGTQVGMEITTDGSWNGTSADFQGTVWVVLYLEGI